MIEEQYGHPIRRIRKFRVDDGDGHFDTMTEYSDTGPYFEVDDVRTLLSQLKVLAPYPGRQIALIDECLRVCEPPSSIL